MLKIFTFTYNRPEFLELQLRSFQKHIKEPFEFVVFNNSTFGRERHNYESINSMCQKLGLKKIDIEMDQGLAIFCQSMEPVALVFSGGNYGSPNVAHAYAFMYAWKHHLQKETGPILILDFDMFPILDQKPTDCLVDNDAVFIPQGRAGLPTDYIWPGYVLLNMDKLPAPETINWWCGYIGTSPTDVGGHSCLYLADHPELRLRKLAFETITDNPEVTFHPSYYQFLRTETGEAIWLHYFRGSGWEHPDQDYTNNKTEWLRRTLNV